MGRPQKISTKNYVNVGFHMKSRRLYFMERAAQCSKRIHFIGVYERKYRIFIR